MNDGLAWSRMDHQTTRNAAPFLEDGAARRLIFRGGFERKQPTGCESHRLEKVRKQQPRVLLEQPGYPRQHVAVGAGRAMGVH